MTKDKTTPSPQTSVRKITKQGVAKHKVQPTKGADDPGRPKRGRERGQENQGEKKK